MTKHCQFPECKKKILSLSIECDKCHLLFCSQHRLPEGHLCFALSDIKKNAFEINKNNLENNKISNSQLNGF